MSFESHKMTDSAQSKTCGMCCMEIAAEAKKCPYCQHWQNKFSMVMFHPAFAVLFAVIPMVLVFGLMGTMFQRMVDPGADFQSYSDQIKVVQSNVRFGNSKCGPTVAVVGRMRNESDVDWKEVNFQVEFLDENGQLVDAGQEFKYSYSLPSQEELAFKVSFRREFSESTYAAHKIRVVSAKDAKARF